MSDFSCILDEQGVIINIIVGVLDSPECKPYYSMAKIGDLYSPPPDPQTPDERLTQLESENTLLKAQIQAQSERSEFIEDCIAEMAIAVYST